MTLRCLTDQQRELDASIPQELVGSLEKIAKAINQWCGDWKTENFHPSPLAFAAYYDLALAAQRLLDSSACSVSRAASTPKVTTISLEFYSLDQIDAIKRWLDIEPLNAMGLVPVTVDVLIDCSQRIETALHALELGCPELHKEFLSITQEIILASSVPSSQLQFRGASSFALWGAVAVNPQVHANWWDYLVTLVHESAHSVLFALSRSGPLVLNAPVERYASPLRHDKRPMDGIYHAAFVSAREAWVLSCCLGSEAFISSDLINAEILGELRRFQQQSLASFDDCLEVIRSHGMLTSLGEHILHDCKINLRGLSKNL